MSAKPAVCVVDDDEDIRNSLKMLFRSRNIPFLGFGSAEEFFEGFQQKNVACVLLDVKMGATNGLDVLDQMRERGIYLPVVLLTGHADVPTAVRAMRSGAIDVVEKPYQDSVLLDKVHQAFAKAENLRKFGSERQVVEPRIASLTPRELEVLDMMVVGKKNRKIAEELGISTKTLDIHRANIMRKMQTKTVADLVRWRLVNQADASGAMPVIVKA
jgi:two-component system response regulator FixJ